MATNRLKLEKVVGDRVELNRGDIIYLADEHDGEFVKQSVPVSLSVGKRNLFDSNVNVSFKTGSRRWLVFEQRGLPLSEGYEIVTQSQRHDNLVLVRGLPKIVSVNELGEITNNVRDGTLYQTIGSIAQGDSSYDERQRLLQEAGLWQ
jgi:hypothetical protein